MAIYEQVTSKLPQEGSAISESLGSVAQGVDVGLKRAVDVARYENELALKKQEQERLKEQMQLSALDKTMSLLSASTKFKGKARVGLLDQVNSLSNKYSLGINIDTAEAIADDDEMKMLVDKLRGALARGDMTKEQVYAQALEIYRSSPEAYHDVMPAVKDLVDKQLEEKKLRSSEKRSEEAFAVKKELAEERAKSLAEKKVKIPQSTLESLSLNQTLKEDAADIEKAIKENSDKFGRGAGTIQGFFNKFSLQKDPKAAELNTSIQVFNQNLAKLLEGGKLTDADRDFYKSQLVKLEDKPEIALQKMSFVKKKLDREYTSIVSTAEKAGLDVGGFKQQTEMSPQQIAKQEPQIIDKRRKQAMEAIGKFPKNESVIRARFKQMTGEDL